MCVGGVHDVVIGDMESLNAISFALPQILIMMHHILVEDNSLSSF